MCLCVRWAPFYPNFYRHRCSWTITLKATMVSTIALHLAALTGCIMHTLEGLTLCGTAFFTHQCRLPSSLTNCCRLSLSSAAPVLCCIKQGFPSKVSAAACYMAQQCHLDDFTVLWIIIHWRENTVGGCFSSVHFSTTVVVSLFFTLTLCYQRTTCCLRPAGDPFCFLSLH